MRVPVYETPKSTTLNPGTPMNSRRGHPKPRAVVEKCDSGIAHEKKHKKLLAWRTEVADLYVARHTTSGTGNGPGRGCRKYPLQCNHTGEVRVGGRRPGTNGDRTRPSRNPAKSAGKQAPCNTCTLVKLMH